MKMLENVSKDISVEDNTYLDNLVSQVIEKHKKNSGQINRIVMDSVTCLATSEARSKGISDQGPINRLWNNLVGKNQKVEANINHDLVSAQRASQKMIQKLAEQNLITFDTVVAVNNKLNSHMIELDKEVEEVYKTLIKFFKQTQSDIVQLGTRLENVERNVNLLHWNETIEYRLFNDVEYKELPQIEKLICITNDFYHATGKNWSTKDLMLLKSTFDNIALPIKSEISLKDFFTYTIEKPHIREKLFEGIPYEGLSNIEPYEAAPIKGIEKVQLLSNEEQYIISTVEKQLTENGVKTSDKSIKIGLIDEYVESFAFRNTDSKMTVFDLSLELLSSLKMTEDEYNRVLEEQNQESESDIQKKALLEDQESEIAQLKECISRKDSLHKDLVIEKRQLVCISKRSISYHFANPDCKLEYFNFVNDNSIVKKDDKILSIRSSWAGDQRFIFLSNINGKIHLLEKPTKLNIFGVLYDESDNFDEVMDWFNHKQIELKERDKDFEDIFPKIKKDNSLSDHKQEFLRPHDIFYFR